MRILRGIAYRAVVARQRALYAASQALAAIALAARRRPAPVVAAVVVGRNDDYMPDFQGRLRATIDWNVRHLVREVLFIEWNPPRDRPLLAPSLASEFPQLKAYIVDDDIHEALCQNERLALLEYHAKNVGLRRARAPLIIATNADVALAPDTMRRVAALAPSDTEVYTAQRVDIDWDDFHQKGLWVGNCLSYRRAIPFTDVGTGDFLLASRSLWHRARGYDESLRKHRIGCDVRGTAQLRVLGATIRKAGCILHLAHPTSCTEEIRPHHGEFAPSDGVPYANGDDWGLGHLSEVAVGERVWRLR